MISQKKAIFHLGVYLISVIIASIALFFTFFQIEHTYHYDQKEQKINTSFLSNKNSLTGDIDILGEGASLIFAFDREKTPHPEDIIITWELSGKSYTRTLDTDEDDDTGRYFTFPFITSSRGTISYSISGIPPESVVSLITTDTSKTSPSIVFHSPFSSATAAAGGLSIVSRSEWGADESIRFWTDAALAKEKQEWEERGRTPLVILETEQQKYERELDLKRGDRIKELRGEAAEVTSIMRYENGKKLLWPVKKTKKVDRITIHHTAENLQQDADDATLIRAIYAYHARTRGWGDIGYNYIIGQRGQIYEGRAGGDYVEGAHAYANNLGSVGISVIGNFQVMQANKDQRKGLEEAIVFFANKYGINILDTTTGVRLCKAGGDCLFDELNISRLHGHRDVGYTTCPGDNLYALIGDMRMSLASRIGSVNPIMNQTPGILESVPPEDKVEYRLKTATIVPIVVKPIVTARGGKPIKIKLSYPYEDYIYLSGPAYLAPDIRLGKRIIKTTEGASMKIHTTEGNMLTIEIDGKKYHSQSVSFSSEVVRIDSWSRIPAWDTAKQYNDNMFRGKIIVYNKDGKILVVNELPLESYLKGLGEVSNGDQSEKIKTIVVAARSYAKYYMDPKNRKYNTALYDGSDDPDSFQRYLGYSYETRSPRVSELVDATRNEVITYAGKVVKAWYFSSSDGRTLSYQEYCSKSGSMTCMNIPYLTSVDDPGGIGKTRAGHGVGISGIGATYFANQGWDYKKIITYYMQGVKIMKKL